MTQPYSDPYASSDQGSSTPAVLSGELVPAGAFDPNQRSYDPYAGAPQSHPSIPQGHPPAAQGQVLPYQGPQGAPYGAPVQQQVFVVQQEKSVAVAFILTFFFGTLGMLYSTVTGTLVMFGIGVLVNALAALISFVTFGFGLVLFVPVWFLLWVGSMIWGCMAASSHNERLRAQAGHMAYAAQTGMYGPTPQQGPYGGC